MAEINQYYDYLTDRGVIVPDTSVILTEIENKFKEIWGQNLDTAPTNAAGSVNRDVPAQPYIHDTMYGGNK